jgi:hypothetical protein
MSGRSAYFGGAYVLSILSLFANNLLSENFLPSDMTILVIIFSWKDPHANICGR